MPQKPQLHWVLLLQSGDPADLGENRRPQYSSLFLGHQAGNLPLCRLPLGRESLHSAKSPPVLVKQAHLSPSRIGVSPFPSPSCCKSGLPWQPLYLLFNWSQSWYVFSVPAYLPKQRHRGWFTLVVILPLRLEQYQLLYFSSFGLTCWTYRCPPMLQELLGLVPILMAFGLQSLASQAAVCVHQL